MVLSVKESSVIPKQLEQATIDDTQQTPLLTQRHPHLKGVPSQGINRRCTSFLY